MKTYKIGLIGFGFIGKVHAKAYHSIPFCFDNPPVCGNVTAILRNNPEKDQELVNSLGIPLCTDDEELFWDQDFDIIDVCSPNDLHYKHCLKAIEKEKPIYCEKPLTIDIENARALVKLVKQHAIPTHTAFTYRPLPALNIAKEMIDAGLLGEIHHFNSQIFHSSYLDPNRPITWRLQGSTAGGGALTDLGIHFLDLIRYLLGDTDWIQCQTKTFIKKRPDATDKSIFHDVNVDDWALCTIGLKNGGIGTLETSRISGGAGDLSRMEIFGSLGSLRLNFNNAENVEFFDVKKNTWISGFNLPNDISHTFYDAGNWPNPRRSLGRFMNAHIASIFYFLKCLENNTASSVDFESALKTQELLHTAYESAAIEGKRVATIE